MTAVARMQHSRGAAADESPSALLLAWYDRERRDLPWRYQPGSAADPYRVWLSEIMLQQTTVKAVIPYFEKFLALWPTVETLAAAPRETILQAWAGLGYYSRATNLHECAIAVVERFAGKFPKTEKDLLELPGIGPYTAAAIAAIGFGVKATPVDGNIERVVARLFAVETPLPKAKAELRGLAATLTPSKRPGDYAQAMMDLGATVCTPKRPSCMMCPLSQKCDAKAKGLTAILPRRSPRPERPTRFGAAFFVMTEAGEVLVRRRLDEGLLASMTEIPSTEWSENFKASRDDFRIAPVSAAWWRVPGLVVHTFTHFRLELTVYRAIVPVKTQLTLFAAQERCRFVNRRDLDRQALPSVMKKIISHALESVA